MQFSGRLSTQIVDRGSQRRAKLLLSRNAYNTRTPKRFGQESLLPNPQKIASQSR